MDFTNVSKQMSSKLQAILPKIAGPGSAPIVDLSVAENDLLRGELVAFIKQAINNNLRIEPNHIIPASGAGNALDSLLCSICDAGDRVLVAGPCWDGFAPYFLIHATATPIIVTTKYLETATEIDIVDALKAAYHADPHPQRIKAVVVTNPNNPLGRCYPRNVLRECLSFCDAQGLHFVSDEVYAMSSFLSDDTDSPPFISALSMLSTVPVAMASRVHVAWSMSKDFGCSGIRLGCIVSQFNHTLRTASILSSYWQISSLTSIAATTLLNSPGLPSLMQRNSARLGASYRLLTAGLTRLCITYIAATHGLFVFVQLAPGCGSAREETAAVEWLAQRGLAVAQGQRFMGAAGAGAGIPVWGWVRITFSTSAERIARALDVVEEFRRDFNWGVGEGE
ncbi:pyridoxal phosphate-dependent transferase [Aspergillus spectabilis]